jgi:hypothetical protein
MTSTIPDTQGQVEDYCDAKWIYNDDELYTTSVYVFSLGGGTVYGSFAIISS